jgi:hypothetical protein
VAILESAAWRELFDKLHVLHLALLGLDRLDGVDYRLDILPLVAHAEDVMTAALRFEHGLTPTRWDATRVTGRPA